MNEYMLIYQGGDPDWKEGLSSEEMNASMEKWASWMSNLEKNDQLLSGGCPLHYSGKRLSNDKIVTDISASELKEIVSGFSMIKAANMNDAVAIAKECPIFDYPDISVQVREVVHMD